MIYFKEIEFIFNKFFYSENVRVKEFFDEFFRIWKEDIVCIL